MFLQIINRRCVFDLLRSCLAPGLCMTRITTKNGYSAGFHIASHCHILYHSCNCPFFPATISVRVKLQQSWATLPSNSGKNFLQRTYIPACWHCCGAFVFDVALSRSLGCS
jgi:hypothetical protein